MSRLIRSTAARLNRLIRRWGATKFSPFAANSSCNVEQLPWQERRSRHAGRRLDQLGAGDHHQDACLLALAAFLHGVGWFRSECVRDEAEFLSAEVG
jgi:hypothetical protein